jgi:hypothetical protein
MSFSKQSLELYEKMRDRLEALGDDTSVFVLPEL